MVHKPPSAVVVLVDEAPDPVICRAVKLDFSAFHMRLAIRWYYSNNDKAKLMNLMVKGIPPRRTRKDSHRFEPCYIQLALRITQWTIFNVLALVHLASSSSVSQNVVQCCIIGWKIPSWLILPAAAAFHLLVAGKQLEFPPAYFACFPA